MNNDSVKSTKEKIPTDLPEIDKPVISRSERLISDDLSQPDLSKIIREPKIKPVPASKEPLGICFKKIGCEIPFLNNVTKKQCKDAGGKSWKGKECKNL